MHTSCAQQYNLCCRQGIVLCRQVFLEFCAFHFWSADSLEVQRKYIDVSPAALSSAPFRFKLEQLHRPGQIWLDIINTSCDDIFTAMKFDVMLKFLLFV